jgi:hypothetical protein
MVADGDGLVTSLPFYYTDFHGGLNTKDAPYLVQDEQARDLQNVQATTAGAIVKRGGLVTFASLPSALTSLYAYEGSPPYLVGAGAGKLYAISSGGVATQIGTGFASDRWEWVQTQSVSGSGPVYGMNGVDTPQQWTGNPASGTTPWVATTGTLQNGKYLILAGNRLWVAGVAAAPSRVYYSDLIPGNNGPVTWPSSGVSVFDEDDGEPITGLARVGPYILVSKRRRLYVIFDLNIGEARHLSDTVGCIANRSMVAAPEGTYLLAEDGGVYLTNGSVVKPISTAIQPTIDALQTRANAAGAYYNSHYYLSVDSSGTAGINDLTLDYDVALQSWWVHTFGSAQYAIWHPTGLPALYSAKATGAIVDQCFVPGVTIDNGQPFTWRWRGPWQSPTFYRRRRFPTPYFKKRFRQMRLDGFGTVDLSLGTDFGATEVLLKSNMFGNVDPEGVFGGAGFYAAEDGSAFGGTAAITRAMQFSLGVYRAISLVFSATSTTSDMVTSYVLMVSDRKDLVVS